jgi:uncharacterized FlaG/YvyC family protein
MASDGQQVTIPVVSLVQGSQAPRTVAIQRSGNALPPSGKAATAAISAGSQLQAQVALLNKLLNDSGRPDQFRVDPASNGKLIQQINPATGDVVGELPADEFEALARSIGISGVIVDKHA